LEEIKAKKDAELKAKHDALITKNETEQK